MGRHDAGHGTDARLPRSVPDSYRVGRKLPVRHAAAKTKVARVGQGTDDADLL